jgi:hypothetical protein
MKILRESTRQVKGEQTVRPNGVDNDSQHDKTGVDDQDKGESTITVHTKPKCNERDHLKEGDRPS